QPGIACSPDAREGTASAALEDTQAAGKRRAEVDDRVELLFLQAGRVVGRFNRVPVIGGENAEPASNRELRLIRRDLQDRIAAVAWRLRKLCKRLGPEA